MLSYLKSEDEFLYDPKTPIEIKEGANFFDILGRFFLNELDRIIREGLLRKYVRIQENSRFLKGKLLIKDQIKQNIIDNSKFFCEYGDLTFDNLENRIILSALHSFVPLIKYNQKLKNELRKLETILKDHVLLTKVTPSEGDKVRLNRISQYYEEILCFSKLILEERYIRSVRPGFSRGFNFIVNMNVVYEEFVTELLEEILITDFADFRIEKQEHFNSLVKEKTIVVKPDVIFEDSQKNYFIIDAKYKKAPANADYYQVIAYSLALKSKKCCLIYPLTENGANHEYVTLIHDLATDHPEETKIHTETIDLYLESDETMSYDLYIEKIKAQLKQIISNFLKS